MKKAIFIPAIGAAILCGCSADSYRKSADADVYRLLRERKSQSLAYQPDTAITSQVAPAAPAKVYEKTPDSPVAPPAPPPIEPVADEGIPYAPLGPDDQWAGLPVTDFQPMLLEKTLEELRRDNETPLYGPPSPRMPANRFDLFKSIQYAVSHSREYVNRTEDLYLSALDVTLERHLLSPRPFMTSGLAYSGGQSDIDYRSALNATAGVGIRQRFPYGGEVVAQTLVQFVNALSDNVEDGESAALVLTGSIPLLRGAGLINLEGLISSERTLIYTVRGFEDYRRQFAVSIASQYFSLLARQQSVENRRKQLHDLEGLLEQQQALFAGGRVTFLQVQRSEQAVLISQNNLLNVQQGYQDAIDDFKINLGMPVEEELQVLPVELEVTVPDIDKLDVLELARTYRLDLQTARDQIDDAKRQVANANNGLLPDLNISGEVRTGSGVSNAAANLDSRSSTYSAGISLDLPIDRVAERNVYRRSLINYQQSQRNLEGLTDRVTADVRSAVRGIRSAQAQTEIARRAISVAERQIELAYLLLKTGQSEARDIVEAQNDLVQAQDDYDQAMVQLQIQVLQFLRDTGTLRVDPQAGSIGRAMDRKTAAVQNPRAAANGANEPAAGR